MRIGHEIQLATLRYLLNFRSIKSFEFQTVDIQLISKLPSHVKERGYAVAATANWGFTPLWALVHDLYGVFVYNNYIASEVNNLNEQGLNVLRSLSPILVLVKASKDPSDIRGLAHALVVEMDSVNEDYLVIDSLRMLRKALKPEILISLVEGLRMHQPKKLKTIYIFLRGDHMNTAREVLTSVALDANH